LFGLGENYIRRGIDVIMDEIMESQWECGERVQMLLENWYLFEVIWAIGRDARIGY
jgi:hypothetical protein